MTALTAGVDLGGTKIQTVVVRGRDVVGSDPRPDAPDRGAGRDRGDRRVAAGIARDRPMPRPPISAASASAPRRDRQRPRHRVRVAERPGVPGTCRARSRGVGGVGRHPRGARERRPGRDARRAQRGAARPYRNVIGVFVGTGVGGGLVLDGKLRDGRGAAGEIGHTVRDPEGPPLLLRSPRPPGVLRGAGPDGGPRAAAGRQWQEDGPVRHHGEGGQAPALERRDREGARRTGSDGALARGRRRVGARDRLGLRPEPPRPRGDHHRRGPGRPAGSAVHRPHRGRHAPRRCSCRRSLPSC